MISLGSVWTSPLGGMRMTLLDGGVWTTPLDGVWRTPVSAARMM